MLNYSANGPSGYNLTNSLRFRSSASASLTRTFTTPTSGTTWTMSFWFKRGLLGVGQELFAKGNTSTQPWTFFYIDGNGALNLYEYSTTGTAPNFNLATNAVFRDPSSWYHIVVAVDTTQATAANRQKIYVNGVQQTFSSASYYPQNTVTTWNSSGGTSYIGRQGGGDYLDGYMTEVNFIDGQALTPSSFGSTNAITGVWQPAKYTGTYGTNGFYLNFSNIALTSGSNTGLGKDYSGNGNYWNTNNISVTSGTTYDAMTDVPTLTSTTTANYAVMNPLKTPIIGTYSNANLTVAFGTNDFTPAQTTIYPTSGKWYWEAVFVSGTYARLGVQNTTVASTDFGSDSAGWRWGSNDGQIYNGTNLITVSTYTTGDILGFCLDLDSGKLYVAKNGTWQNSAVPSSGTGAVATNIPTNTPMSPAGSTGYLPTTLTWNFGQRPFSYTPPTGFNPLNTYNLPTSTIVQGNKYMDATLYTGNGGGTNTQNVVNAAGFKPDLVWPKSRSNAVNHNLFDSVRGATKGLISNTTDAEITDANSLTAFNSNGFTVGPSTITLAPNYPGYTYVAWQWQAGQGTNTTNTQGSITSTVSVNASAGFSVVTWSGNSTSGATIGHGLGVAPKFIIMKRRNSATNWQVWVTGFNATTFLFLQSTNAVSTTENYFNSTLPSSTLITLSANSEVNTTGGTYVAYCWAEIAGFSKFGSYTGNGSQDGTFVYTGFRPKFVLFKKTSGASDWYIYDSSRNPYNLTNLKLSPNSSSAEFTQSPSVNEPIDILSNGFKLRGTGGDGNANGATYMYVCFASNPFKNSLAF